MFKFLLVACMLAVAAANPKPQYYAYSPYAAYTAPVAAAYTAPVAYSAYSAYTPYAYAGSPYASYYYR